MHPGHGVHSARRGALGNGRRGRSGTVIRVTRPQQTGNAARGSRGQDEAVNLLVTNARLIPVNPDLPDLGYLERGWMHVVDGRIAALGDGDAPLIDRAEILDVEGKFVAPG